MITFILRGKKFVAKTHKSTKYNFVTIEKRQHQKKDLLQDGTEPHLGPITWFKSYTSPFL